jgi:hypothetical protein
MSLFALAWLSCINAAQEPWCEHACSGLGRNKWHCLSLVSVRLSARCILLRPHTTPSTSYHSIASTNLSIPLLILRHDDDVSVDGVRLRLWTMATSGPIVHPSDMSMENHGRMILTGENSWFIHQSLLAILPTELSSSKGGGTGEVSYEFSRHSISVTLWNVL